MFKKVFLCALCGVLFLTAPALSIAQSELVFPKPAGYVNDFANFLKPETKKALEASLRQLEQEKGHEIVIVTTPNLQETTIEDLAVRWFEAWGIGKKNADNGILMLIVPSERLMRIEVGYGLEGAIPDSLAGQVMDNLIIPEIQAGEPDAGVIAGVDALIKLAAGESVDVGRSQQQSEGVNLGLILMLFLIGAGLYNKIAVVPSLQNKMRRPLVRGIFVTVLSLFGALIAIFSSNLAFWIWFLIFEATLGTGFFLLLARAGAIAFLSGRGIFSGRGHGGGGFGGFGGGRSGGGGASRGW